MNTGIDKRLCIRVPEAMEMLGISRNLMYALIKQERLCVIEFGKRLVIARAGLGRMIEKSV